MLEWACVHVHFTRRKTTKLKVRDFILKDTAKLPSPKKVWTIYMLRIWKYTDFSSLLPKNIILFNFCQSDGIKSYLVALMCNSLIINEVKHLFVFIGHLFPFCQCLFISFAHFSSVFLLICRSLFIYSVFILCVLHMAYFLLVCYLSFNYICDFVFGDTDIPNLLMVKFIHHFPAIPKITYM